MATISLRVPQVADLKPRIAVIGVGGAGGNAINNMIQNGLDGVEYIVANTDAQALQCSSAERRIQLGATLTEGLGAGAKPERGEAAAEEAADDIKSQITGCHMVFIAAGMGGGTGTGAAPVIARLARELGILTVAIVTKPFQFEGLNRMRMAEAGIARMRQHVDTLIVIPNHNLFKLANARTSFRDAFIMADNVLFSGIACIVDLIVKDGLINLDLADVKTVLSDMGTAMMGTGLRNGEKRALLAAEDAIMNPLLEDIDLSTARGLIISIMGRHDLTLHEVDEAANRVRHAVAPDATIIVGTAFDDQMDEGYVRVSIIASGMQLREPGTEPQRAQQPAAPHIEPNASAGRASGGYATQAPLPHYPQQHFVEHPSAPQPDYSTGTQMPHAVDPALQAAWAQQAPTQQNVPSLSYPRAVEHTAWSELLTDTASVAPAHSNPSAQAPQRSMAVPTGPAAHGSAPSAIWIGPGQVEIEDRPMVFHDTSAASHAQRVAPTAEPVYASETKAFQPQPTADTRRPGRRALDMQDFSKHAQDIYHGRNVPQGTEAPRGSGATRQGLNAPPESEQPLGDASANESGQRGGLMRRLTSAGFRRK